MIHRGHSNLEKVSTSRTLQSNHLIDLTRLRSHDCSPCLAHRAFGSPMPARTVPQVGREASALSCRLSRHSNQKRALRSDWHSMRTRDPYFASMAKSSNPCGGPHSGTDHLVRNFPVASNTCIRLFIGSATYTLLFPGSTATEVGSLNCPSPVPLLPQIDSTRPSGLNLTIRVWP